MGRKELGKEGATDYLLEVSRHVYEDRLDEEEFMYTKMLKRLLKNEKGNSIDSIPRGSKIIALQKMADHITKLRSSNDKHDREVGKQLYLEREYIRARERENLKLAIQMALDTQNISDIYTLAEIGEVLGITRERARQLEMQASKILKHPKVAQRLKKYNEE